MLTNYYKVCDMGPGFIADIARSKIKDVISEEEIRAICEETVFDLFMPWEKSIAQYKKLISKVYACLRCELETLQEIADDPDVTEIMVNGCDSIFVEKNGFISKADFTLDSKEQLKGIIQRLAAKVGRECNDLNPILDARLMDGSRINAINDNVALNGPILSIRKFKQSGLRMDDLIKRNDISKEAAEFLIRAVECGFNILICGGTSSGKTTFLNILSDYIPKGERIIVIEDSAELSIRGHDNVVRMESRNASSSGKRIEIKDLIKASLRMRPDRLIIGEVRGQEAFDMVDALGTGHDGSLSTGHANSCEGMLVRLEGLCMMQGLQSEDSLRMRISESIDLLVLLKRSSDGFRRVEEIAEPLLPQGNCFKVNTIFKRDKEDSLKEIGKLLRSDKPCHQYYLRGIEERN